MDYFKVIVVGDIAVGKTTLIGRFVTGSFSREYKATIGVDIFTKKMTADRERQVSLQLWDIAGQTSFQQFRQSFFTKARGALLVYDLTVPSSLENIQKSWIVDIERITGQIPLVLIGNKVDLKTSNTIAPKEIVSVLMKNPNVKAHFHTSALTGENVENAFQTLVSMIIDSLNPLIE